jgi:homotetrameric cytidine deaminase
MDAPRRNVELKATDPDPEATLERALAAGARDQGVLVQRDTYFGAPRGRLKLREEEPGEEHLIAYERADEARARTSAYRIAPATAELLDVLEAALGVTQVVEKRRRLLLWESVRIHLDDVAGLGRFVELEAVAEGDSDLAREHEQVRMLREVLAIGDGTLQTGSYADALAAREGVAPGEVAASEGADALAAREGAAPGGVAASEGAAPGGAPGADPELLAMARAAAANAYAPYSDFPVGAAVRTADGRRYAGANVENAAYPQGQCAEASALGAMVAGGGGPVVEVVVAAPSPELVSPCGGCRQRLREFAAPGTPIHLADMERVKHTTTMAELLPLSFGPETLG